jgi:uncharacterized protein
VRSVLLDSGPLIALFAVDDKHHEHYDQLVTSLSGGGLRMLTTWPCIVEASYLLDLPHRFEMLHWIELGGAVVYPFEAHHLGDMLEWMRKYSKGKREMDLADASLYWLASETSISQVMTVDVADFSRYRLPNGTGFEVL